MARVALGEDHPVTSRQSRSQTGGAHEDQHGNASFNAQVIARLIEGIACRRRQRGRHGIAQKSDLLVDAAAQLANALRAGALRIDVDPMYEEDIWVVGLRLEP